MAVKQAIQVGNPVIRAKTKQVKGQVVTNIKKVIRDLTDSMREHNLVGMAAPQIGESLRIFVTEIRKTKFRKDEELDELRVFINPKIIETSSKQSKDWEGCGSVAESGLFAKVARPESISVEAINESGEKFSLKAKSLLARVIQHEMDHLDGVLFIDKADLATAMSRNEYLKFKEQALKKF
jgi:peptide deformylase